MKRWSLDARSKGQPGHSLLSERFKRGMGDGRAQKIISLHPLLCERYPNPQFHFEGSLVDPRLRASNDINAPSKLARYFSGMGAD